MTANLAPSSGAPLVMLFPAVVIAGFGLGLLALALALPARDAALLPPPDAVVPLVQTGADGGTISTTVAAWAPLFGEPAPEPVAAPPLPEPEPEPEPFDGAPYFDTSAYVLRGLAFEIDGGWALLETDGETSVIREGSNLPGGEEVTLIAEDGVEISIDGEAYFIGFDGEYGDMLEPSDNPQFAPDDPAIDQHTTGGLAPRTNYGICGIGR